MLRTFATVLLLLFFWAPIAQAFYISPEQVDLTALLAPPPTPDSEAQKRDLMDVLRAQETRTPEEAARAVADNDVSPGRIAGEVLGSVFETERLPKTAEFLKRTMEDVRTVFLAAKNAWHRPRPFTVSESVKPIGEIPTSGSYPSGHATRGYLTAIILAQMVPEKSTELFARGREYGRERVVAGDHYPSDVEAGRFVATAVAVALLQSPAFVKDFMDAKAELRAALNLPNQ